MVIFGAGAERGLRSAGCTEQWTGNTPWPGSVAAHMRTAEFHPRVGRRGAGAR